jgi:peptidase E
LKGRITTKYITKVMRLYPYLSVLRGVFVGSGSEGMQQAEIAQSILSLALRDSVKAASDLSVVYLGTATYDAPGPKAAQTSLLAAAGCKISDLVIHQNRALTDSNRIDIETADIILVSGGNTLYACDLWRHVGLMVSDCKTSLR